MNLAQIVSQIGSMLPETDNLPFIPLPKPKEGEGSCTVKLIFDLSKKQLYFKFHSRDRTERELYYFGNNKGASTQFFLVRDLKSIKYLLGTALSDLFLELEKYNMQDCELAQILKQLYEAGLYIQAAKRKGGYLSTDKWSVSSGEEVTFDKDKVKFIVSGQEVTAEKMISKTIELNPREKINVVIPAVIFPDGSEVELNAHPDYHKLVLKSLNLDAEGIEQVDQRKLQTCHLCHQALPHVASDKYLAKLSRTGINKIFTTTTINSASGIKKTGYENSYAVCRQCYEKLRRGEGYVAEKLTGRIVGEKVFILPEGLQRPFTSYEFFPRVKNAVDFVFQAKDAKIWYEQAISEAEEQLFTNGYTINLIFYRTDGTSISILDAFEDVPPLRLMEIMKRFGVWSDRMRSRTNKCMTLGRIYHIIPVRTVEIDNKKIQVNIQRVLSVYKALLLKQLFNPRLLFQYAMEAIDKGLSQIHKQKKEIFPNLPFYAKGNEDFYIRDIVMNYLVLMQVLQENNILEKTIFRKDVKVVQQIFQNEKVNQSIQRMEEFLQEQGFSAEAKGLFYLGALLHRVALAQYSKGHTTKPILKKINFQGMKPRDMQRLLAECTEKLLQYQRMTAFSDALTSKHQAYYSSIVAGAPSGLDELQNVFFLLTGYSYMVGSKIPDANKEEEEAQKSLMTEEETE